MVAAAAATSVSLVGPGSGCCKAGKLPMQEVSSMTLILSNGKCNGKSITA